MPSEQHVIEQILQKLKNAGEISTKKMMGECLIYVNGKYVALISDNKLYLKSTSAGENFITNVKLEAPYPGAKPAFLIETLDNQNWLCELVQLTANALPDPKPKVKK